MTTLIVMDQAPYGSWCGREGLDMAFSLAAFDQPVALLFMGAGVNWLRPGQLPEAIQQKSVEKHLGAATVFGIEAMYADQVACERYRLTQEELMAGVIFNDSVPNLIQSHPRVLFAG